MIVFEHVSQIILPDSRWQEILKHCNRKLEGKHLPGESKDRKACGLVAGVQDESNLIVDCIIPVRRNVRDQEPYKTYMDKIMEEHAIPSETPLSGRGWITDPEELKACYDRCDQEKLVVFGTYHMHVVPWDHDALRDTPTYLDTVLAKNSGLYSLIVSMVDKSHPRIRGFYEGLVEQEIPILIQDRGLASAHG